MCYIGYGLPMNIISCNSTNIEDVIKNDYAFYVLQVNWNLDIDGYHRTDSIVPFPPATDKKQIFINKWNKHAGKNSSIRFIITATNNPNSVLIEQIKHFTNKLYGVYPTKYIFVTKN